MKAILMIIVVLILLTGCSSSGVSGNEWLLMQEPCLEDLESFARGMDEVFSLYFIGAISISDFSTELQVLSLQYSIIQEVYEKYKEEHPILPESNSYISQKGIEGIDNARFYLGQILYASKDAFGFVIPADELAYLYFAYRQKISESMAQYSTALLWLHDISDQNAGGK